MNKILSGVLFFVALLLVSNIVFSCKTQRSSAPKVKGRLVHTSCASAVVQVLDESQYSLGQDAWQQSESKPILDHVFAVNNQCSFKANNIKVGDEFYFQLTDTVEKDCVVCMLWDNPPSKTQNIVVVK